MAVLKVCFKDIGLKKVERREFAMFDAKGSRSLDLNRPWEAIMKPGQNANMSMIFNTRLDQSSCPRCNSNNETAPKEDTKW